MNESKIVPFRTPAFGSEQPDVTEMMVDGKMETMLSARGVVLFCLGYWREEQNELAHDGLRRYCEYIAAHGHRSGATKALAELDALGTDEAIAWIRRTFAQHVQDQNSLVQYVMGPLLGGLTQ